ncbi:MAG: hypothetical protein J5554_12355 [Paludibacteraceae bacterium]|nr:hypothetical protein [Paludibacteraceae bacterium]
MKKRFLFSTLAVLFSMSCAVFTSCGDDDDDDSVEITYSINGEKVEDDAKVNLEKAENGLKGNDIITLAITSSAAINSIQINVTNEWENKVDVVTIDSVLLGANNKLSESNMQEVSFVGVLGKYSVKVNTTEGSESFSFTTQCKNKDAKTYYNSATRSLCNKQLIVFDANNDKKESAKTLNMTYKVNDTDGIRYFTGKVKEIEEEQYQDYSTFTVRAFGEEGEEMENFSDRRDIKECPRFFVYKDGDKYYLIKVISIKNNVLTAEVQY